MNGNTVWERAGAREAAEAFCEGYKDFLNRCKTERETAARVAAMAEEAGFKNLDTLLSEGTPLQAGDKVYSLMHHKAAALFVLGQEPLSRGMKLICAHGDAPRLDLRPRPLYEKEGLALLRTHYYGGIKKYQWAAMPLSLHGVIVKKGGERIPVSMGEEEGEPVLYISDLPKHLSARQSQQTMAEGITGEDLNLIAGSIPLEGEGPGGYLLKLLYKKYGVEEEDLLCAELEAVPAGKARDAGLDGSMIAAYGHDDRSCAYAGLQAILETEAPVYTAGFMLVDKEEVGNQGATGMQSRMLENLTAKLLHLQGDSSPLSLRLALEQSQLLSADVVLGMDPGHGECFAPGNTAHLGGGPAIVKYAGHFGKKDANDANAEFLGLLRDVFDGENICWQTGEYGRMDLGGGGTIAPLPARYGMQVADCGVPLLSMHAPYELASKADVYEASRAYGAFLRSTVSMDAYM